MILYKRKHEKQSVCLCDTNFITLQLPSEIRIIDGLDLSMVYYFRPIEKELSSIYIVPSY
jgi:hypothetical protein